MGGPFDAVHSAATGGVLLSPAVNDAGGLSPSLGLRLYGPRLTPFLRSLRCPSTHLSARLYFWHRVQGRWSSQRLHAAAQLVHWDISKRSTICIWRSEFCAYSHFHLAPLRTGGRGCPAGRLRLWTGGRGKSCRRESVKKPGWRWIWKHVGSRRRGRPISIWIRRIRGRWISEERWGISSRGRWGERIRVRGLLWSSCRCRCSFGGLIVCHGDVAEISATKRGCTTILRGPNLLEFGQLVFSVLGGYKRQRRGSSVLGTIGRA